MFIDDNNIGDENKKVNESIIADLDCERTTCES